MAAETRAIRRPDDFFDTDGTLEHAQRISHSRGEIHGPDCDQGLIGDDSSPWMLIHCDSTAGCCFTVALDAGAAAATRIHAITKTADGAERDGC